MVLELTASQPVTTGRLAGRRVVLVPDPVPGAGDSVTLSVGAAALEDAFLNRRTGDFTLSFPWPAADAVLHDSAAPEVDQVVVRGGVLEVQLSEEADPAAANVLQVEGGSVTWTLSADRYALTSATPLATGTHALTLGTSPLDLSGQGLEASFDVSFALPAENLSGRHGARDAGEDQGCLDDWIPRGDQGTPADAMAAASSPPDGSPSSAAGAAPLPRSPSRSSGRSLPLRAMASAMASSR